MEILELMTSQGNVVMVRIKITTYTDNGYIYIGLVSVDGELEEPFADVTVNLGGDAIEYCGYLDTVITSYSIHYTKLYEDYY